ncbi:MAG: MerR family transcriptional regulator [Rhodobacteraceae bacterium]|nr:MerR family transcriptional regulator [Paracoccaceae bacterium]
MKQQTPIHEFVGIGLYSVADAAQLLKEQPRTLRRWLDGYDYKNDDEIRHVAPLWKLDIPKIDDEIGLSFRDLIELRFIRAFLKTGVSLKTVRDCIDYAQKCIQTDRPFSSSRFRTDGYTIFLESLQAAGEPQLLDLKKKQYAFKKIVEQSFKDLDQEDEIVKRWRPYHGKDSIVIDPTRSFGQPIASASGVPTIVLAEAVKAEGSPSWVARMYEVEKSVVQDAVKFQEGLMAA